MYNNIESKLAYQENYEGSTKYAPLRIFLIEAYSKYYAEISGKGVKPRNFEGWLDHLFRVFSGEFIPNNIPPEILSLIFEIIAEYNKYRSECALRGEKPMPIGSWVSQRLGERDKEKQGSELESSLEGDTLEYFSEIEAYR